MPRSNLENLKKKEKSTASKVARYIGLCFTCNNAPDCCLIGNIDQPVFFCEEFNIYQQTQAKPLDNITLQAVNSQGIFSPEVKESTKYQGLCVNCENREICIFQKPESGNAMNNLRNTRVSS